MERGPNLVTLPSPLSPSHNAQNSQVYLIHFVSIRRRTHETKTITIREQQAMEAPPLPNMISFFVAAAVLAIVAVYHYSCCFCCCFVFKVALHLTHNSCTHIRTLLFAVLWGSQCVAPTLLSFTNIVIIIILRVNCSLFVIILF